MLDAFAQRIASLGRLPSRRSLPFARDALGNLSVRAGRVAFDVVLDVGTHRRRLYTATLWDADGRRGYLRRARDQDACVRACEAAAVQDSQGLTLASVPCVVSLGSNPIQVPCALALTRTPGAGLTIELLPHSGASHTVRPAFIPNFLSGTVGAVGFRAGSEQVGHVADIPALIRACIDAPGLLTNAERSDAAWGVVMATVLAAGGIGPDGQRDRRSVDILRERDRVVTGGGTCPERLDDLAFRAASHLAGRADVWSSIKGLPQADDILELAQGTVPGYAHVVP